VGDPNYDLGQILGSQILMASEQYDVGFLWEFQYERLELIWSINGYGDQGGNGWQSAPDAPNAAGTGAMAIFLLGTLELAVDPYLFFWMDDS